MQGALFCNSEAEPLCMAGGKLSQRDGRPLESRGCQTIQETNAMTDSYVWLSVFSFADSV